LGENKLNERGRCVVRALVAVVARPLIVKLLIDCADELDWDHIEAIREEKQFLLAGRRPLQKPLKPVQVLLLDAIPLSVVDWESVPVEVIRQLPEKGVGEVLVLQDAKKTQFRHAWFESRR